MKEKKAGERLTLEEMFDIFEGEVYKEWREDHDIVIERDKEGNRFTRQYPPTWYMYMSTPLIYKHILACQTYSALSDANSWLWQTGDVLTHEWALRLGVFWLHPLVWVDSEMYKCEVVYGYLAIEEYDNGRIADVMRAFSQIEEHRVLDYAQSEHEALKEDHPEIGYMKGMHIWDVLTENATPLYEEVLKGHGFDYNDIYRVKRFDAKCFRKRILLIAEEYSPKRAAEFVRQLQSEWPGIKVWKCALDEMTPDEIQEFENCLMYGFDDLLAEWEGERQPVSQPINKNQSFETLLQCPKDQKTAVMSRLHELLDNKGGKSVALILMAAKQKYSLLLDIPTENQYKSEFILSGTWRAVLDYIKKHTLQNGKYSVDIDHISIL